MAKFTRTNKTVDAVRYDGTEKTAKEIDVMTGKDNPVTVEGRRLAVYYGRLKMKVSVGNWVVKNEGGNISVMSDELFQKKYEAVAAGRKVDKTLSSKKGVVAVEKKG